MGLLVEDLLLLARLDQQRPLTWQPVDLPVLAGNPCRPGHRTGARTIELEVRDSPDKLVAYGDDARLRQVIGNLMTNALTHTPSRTPIEVSIGSGTLDPRLPSSSPAVTLDVTDHGPGMTPEQAHRVFERFYRTDQARTRATGGSGLGLAIVNALVSAHGGVASVRTGTRQGGDVPDRPAARPRGVRRRDRGRRLRPGRGGRGGRGTGGQRHGGRGGWRYGGRGRRDVRRQALRRVAVALIRGRSHHRGSLDP